MVGTGRIAHMVADVKGMTKDMRRGKEMEFPELQTIGYVRIRLDEPAILDFPDDEEDDWDDDPIGGP